MEFQEFEKIVTENFGSIIGKPKLWKNVSINIKKKASHFIFSESAKVENLNFIDFGGNNTISIGKNSKLTGLVKLGSNSKLEIGEDFTCTGNVKIHIAEETTLKIGDDCMFGLDVNIYTHDYHVILDKETNSRINKSKNITIHNHVWIGNSATILKGCEIGDNSVIGAYSVLTKSIPNSTIAAGNPAKIIRKGISWTRESLTSI